MRLRGTRDFELLYRQKPPARRNANSRYAGKEEAANAEALTELPSPTAAMATMNPLNHSNCLRRSGSFDLAAAIGSATRPARPTTQEYVERRTLDTNGLSVEKSTPVTS